MDHSVVLTINTPFGQHVQELVGIHLNGHIGWLAIPVLEGAAKVCRIDILPLGFLQISEDALELHHQEEDQRKVRRNTSERVAAILHTVCDDVAEYTHDPGAVARWAGYVYGRL